MMHLLDTSKPELGRTQAFPSVLWFPGWVPTLMRQGLKPRRPVSALLFLVG